MDVLRWYFESVPAWFWHHATHIQLGSLGGGWIGWLIIAMIWSGEALLFAVYALTTLCVVGFLILGVGKALHAAGRSFVTGYRQGAQR